MKRSASLVASPPACQFHVGLVDGEHAHADAAALAGPHHPGVRQFPVEVGPGVAPVVADTPFQAHGVAFHVHQGQGEALFAGEGARAIAAHRVRRGDGESLHQHPAPLQRRGDQARVQRPAETDRLAPVTPGKAGGQGRLEGRVDRRRALLQPQRLAVQVLPRQVGGPLQTGAVQGPAGARRGPPDFVIGGVVEQEIAECGHLADPVQVQTEVDGQGRNDAQTGAEEPASGLFAHIEGAQPQGIGQEPHLPRRLVIDQGAEDAVTTRGDHPPGVRAAQ
ncbi:hypothetical protein [uncultured Thiodictyon sp.]|uniref:hypothetical protein n=1 Tax=uncultured Thiodictyon sp. TaxID=1846217 RepID=UPI0025E70020|nr:hypothetical protein [uncultured Thiodictyon sp.]